MFGKENIIVMCECVCMGEGEREREGGDRVEIK